MVAFDSSDIERKIRLRAFAWLTEQVDMHGDVLPRPLLAHGFIIEGRHERVMRAYREQCAVCCLRHIELLDAAHIIPDTEEAGEPEVSNGLALCKLHHAAFDRFLLGITPDYVVELREDVLEEADGPMLRHGLQGLHQSKLVLPRHRRDWPDRERLDMRYTRFRKTG